MTNIKIISDGGFTGLMQGIKLPVVVKGRVIGEFAVVREGELRAAGSTGIEDGDDDYPWNFILGTEAVLIGDEHDEISHVEGGRKDDSGKSLMHLIPPHAEMALARVLTFGARKYAPENWRKVENPEQRYMAAAMRHMNAHRAGEVRDGESGELHLSHALTCLAFLVEIEELRDGEEKRKATD